MALINYTSTTYLKAFILYAIVAALITGIGVHLRLLLEDPHSELYILLAPLTPEIGINKTHKLILSILISFFASIIIYHIMYFIFGWGGGMLVSSKKTLQKYA